MPASCVVNGPDDVDPASQRPAAVGAMTGRVFVSLTVVLEFEWVLRGFDELGGAYVIRVPRALASISHDEIEDAKPEQIRVACSVWFQVTLERTG